MTAIDWRTDVATANKDLTFTVATKMIEKFWNEGKIKTQEGKYEKYRIQFALDFRLYLMMVDRKGMFEKELELVEVVENQLKSTTSTTSGTLVSA